MIPHLVLFLNVSAKSLRSFRSISAQVQSVAEHSGKWSKSLSVIGHVPAVLCVSGTVLSPRLIYMFQYFVFESA